MVGFRMIKKPAAFSPKNVGVSIERWPHYLKCVSIHVFREYSSPRRARPVGAMPSSRAQCAMAARCPCFATASRIPSKPSSALPATRTACSPVWAAAPEDATCLTRHPLRRTSNWTVTRAVKWNTAALFLHGHVSKENRSLWWKKTVNWGIWDCWSGELIHENNLLIFLWAQCKIPIDGAAN